MARSWALRGADACLRDGYSCCFTVESSGGESMTRLPSGNTVRVAALVASAAFGCASTPGARPGDMSAKSHDEEARKHSDMAEQHDAQYDPNARGGTPPDAISGSEFGFAGTELNPTEVHRMQADKHRAHAEDHAAAADWLKRTEDDACEPISPTSRSLCPLLGPVVAVQDTTTGVRLFLRQGTDLEAMVARIRCHLAFARTRGGAGMDRCPLYLPAIDVYRVGPLEIELNARRQTSVRPLQRRVADHVAE